MGIVIKQSISNTIITYIGFAIGAANTLYMYPQFLGDTYYGLTGYLLSTANILMPVMAFGVHNTIIKYFSQYKTEREKSQFLSFVLLLPMFFLIPFLLTGFFVYDQIASYLSEENPIIYGFVWQVPVIGLCMGYFEIFYAWVKVHLKSVFGSFIKEVLLRIFISVALFAVYLDWIDAETFVNLLMLIYLIAMLVMAGYAASVRGFVIRWNFPNNKRAVFAYSMFIILSGSIANILLDIDKNMLGKYTAIENIAYYSVAIFIALVISVPSRAMHQITAPITATLMSSNKHDELNRLYKNSSITLQAVGGLVFVGILVNLNMLYTMLPEEYAQGTFAVFAIGLSKYFDLILGNNNAIIFNSKYYRTVLLLGLLLAVVAISLNAWLIPVWGIDGAAMATLVSITLYSAAKLLFVVFKMNLFPFSRNTIVSGLIALVCFVSFYYWEFPFHPVINIGMKSVLVGGLYTAAHYLLKVSDELNSVMVSMLKRVGVNLR